MEASKIFSNKQVQKIYEAFVIHAKLFNEGKLKEFSINNVVEFAFPDVDPNSKKQILQTNEEGRDLTALIDNWWLQQGVTSNMRRGFGRKKARIQYQEVMAEYMTTEDRGSGRVEEANENQEDYTAKHTVQFLAIPHAQNPNKVLLQVIGEPQKFYVVDLKDAL